MKGTPSGQDEDRHLTATTFPNAETEKPCSVLHRVRGQNSISGGSRAALEDKGHALLRQDGFSPGTRLVSKH